MIERLQEIIPKETAKMVREFTELTTPELKEYYDKQKEVLKNQDFFLKISCGRWDLFTNITILGIINKKITETGTCE